MLDVSLEGKVAIVTGGCRGMGREMAIAFARAGMAPTVIVRMALWLASRASDGVTGCRYIARHGDGRLEPAEAAELCREQAVFPVPARETPLEDAWRSGAA